MNDNIPSSFSKPTLLRHYIEIIVANLGFILKFLLVCLLFGAATVFTIPKTYTAKVILMPPEDPNKQNPLTQAAGALGLGALGASGNATDVLTEMLKSRVVAESLIVQQNLEDVFLSKAEREKSELEKTEILVKTLSDISRFTTNKSGYITIEVKAATPAFSFSNQDDDSARALCVRIANGYVTTLDKINRRLANLKSLYNAEYFAEQVRQAKAELDTAYGIFERFQTSNKAVAISEQMKLQLETVSRIKAQMLAEELQLDMLLRDRQPSDMLVTESKLRLAEYRKKYEESLRGKSDRLSLGFDEMPAISREYANYFREVKIHEEVYGLLKQLYFKERVQGYRDTPTVVILDAAKPPFNRTSPKRGLALLVILVISLFAAIALIFLLEWLKRAQSDEGYLRLRQLLKSQQENFFKPLIKRA